MPPRRETPPLEETLANLADSLQQLLTATNTSANRLDTLTHAISKQSDTLASQIAKQTETTSNLVNTLVKPDLDAASSSATPTRPPPLQPPPNNTSQTIKPPKIHLPTFDGTDPLDWLFQADKYFSFYTIPDNEKVALAVFYFKGDTLSWYKHLANNQLLGSWTDFSRALELRFGPSSFANHQATLFKLKQLTTVSAYQSDFEHISNCVIGLFADALLNCFLSGLRPDIQAELSLHNPRSLHNAYGHAKR
ncbi:hypothetical protein OSB04_000460 [Centaurea solstitialis]|uniref:Retrotransposon gag domain-containing protein n=1 Tax=Centaurea solstitialis TaxID=347529 RepID=A0AA38TPA5_9ASTR|nr:hypothetical protein OSB04_000460 [Centaurea solstitialis]